MKLVIGTVGLSWGVEWSSQKQDIVGKLSSTLSTMLSILWGFPHTTQTAKYVLNLGLSGMHSSKSGYPISFYSEFVLLVACSINKCLHRHARICSNTGTCGLCRLSTKDNGGAQVRQSYRKSWQCVGGRLLNT